MKSYFHAYYDTHNKKDECDEVLLLFWLMNGEIITFTLIGEEIARIIDVQINGEKKIFSKKYKIVVDKEQDILKW